MSDSLREIITDFVRGQYEDPSAADPAKLHQYPEEAERRVHESQMAPGAVHDLFGLYWLLRDREACLALLRQYLKRDLPVEEEAWARWNVVDHLALLRRPDELVPTHKEFLDWARGHLEPDRWFWAMHDPTQSMGWFRGGYGDEWMAIFWELNEEVASSAENRLHRFWHHQAAAYALNRFQRPQEARQISDRMLAIALEDPDWPYAHFVEMESWIRKVEAAGALGERSSLAKLADEVGRRLEVLRAGLPEPEVAAQVKPSVLGPLHPADRLGRYRNERAQRDPVICYRGICHDLAAVLYRAKEYRQATPLFEQAITYGINTVHTYAWHAACVWAATKDRCRVAELLKRLENRFPGHKDVWRRLPEFEVLREDEQFAELLSG